MSGFWALALAMGRGFVRDRTALFFALLFPMMFLVLFGGIFTNQGATKSSLIEVGRVGVLDHASAALRRQLAQSLTITHTDDLASALEQVRTGDADALITTPTASMGTGTQIELRYSAADPVTAATVRGTMSAILAAANLEATGQPARYGLQAAPVEDRSLSSIQYVTPGLLGWAVATGATFGAAATLVVWRRRGILRRLRLAPVPTYSIVLSRVVVSVGVALTQGVIFVGAALAFFGLRLTGWWWLSVPLLIAGTLSFMSIGLLAGSICKTEEGATALDNFIVLPMAFLSGSFFRLDGSPGWLQAISHLLPLRHLNDGMLDVLVRGEGPSAIVGPLVVLLGFAAVLTTISARMFRWDSV